MLHQLESRKNAIEIELNERLRRRQEELQVKLESLGELENGDSSTADSLVSRTRELKSLNASIQTLTGKVQSESSLWCTYAYSLAHQSYGAGGRRSHCRTARTPILTGESSDTTV